MEKTRTRWVVVACCDDMEQAKRYKTLLLESGIRAILRPSTKGAHVKVPVDFVQQANNIIAWYEASRPGDQVAELVESTA